MSTNAQAQHHLELAVLALGKNQLEEGARHFADAIYLSPRDVVLRQRLGDLLARMGRISAAIQQFQHVAGSYAAQGQLLKAIAICRVILEMDPEHHETQETLAELYSLQHETRPFQARLPASMSGALNIEKGPQLGEVDPLAHDDAPAVTQENAPLELAVRELFDEAPEAATELELAAIEDLSEPVVLDFSSLGRAPLFSKLHKDAFLAVIQRLELRWVKAGEVIVSEGDAGDSMFVVVQGVMNVVRGRPSESVVSKPIALLGEASFFGEMALVAGSPRLATVVAATDGLLFEIDRTALDELSAQYPTLREAVHEFYRERLLSNLLSSSALFRPFDADGKRDLASRFTLHHLAAGTLVLEQGKPGQGLFVLLRGRCEVFHRGPDGQEKPYPSMREGDVFGEISLMMSAPCTASVRCAGPCEVLELPAEDFRTLVLPNAQVKKMIDRMVRERLQRTADLLAATGEADLPTSYLV